jgi:hypothetical protein
MLARGRWVMIDEDPDQDPDLGWLLLIMATIAIVLTTINKAMSDA